MTGQPTNGTVYLADGVTPVIAGNLLTAAQFAGLEFIGGPGTEGQSSQFTYTAIDATGWSASGSATLSVVANPDGPQTSPASLTVAENAGPTAIGITAPTDPNYAAAQLAVAVTTLPTNGTVYLADGVTAVTAGEILTVDQLTGLTFAPIAGAFWQSSAFGYTVTDPAGSSTPGIANLSGTDTLVINCTGDYYPQFKVYINGVQVGDTQTVSASNALGQTQNFTLTGNFSAAQTVDVEFINDGATPLGGDINLFVNSMTLDGQVYLPGDGEFNRYNSSGFLPGTGTGGLYWDGTLRFLVGPDPITVGPTPSLSVFAGGTPTAIGISVPSDTSYDPSSLQVLVTGQPTNGTLYLADGVTPVIAGQTLTVAQLAGLEFAGSLGTAANSSQFTYTVLDATGWSASGSATLSVVANPNGPQTSPASLTVAENAAPAAIGISAPTDPQYSTDALSVSVLGVPTNGTVTLSDGVTPVTPGQSLTMVQLTGLKFAPMPGLVALSEQFVYSVADPAGNINSGNATLAIAPAAGSRVLTVGPGQQYSTIAAAIAASQNGDTIQVQAGTYINDFATINDDITLEGVGGMVNMVATGTALANSNDKGIFVTNGNDIINNFSFSGAQADPGSANGAGIRYQAGNLVLNDDYFVNNQNGLLGAANPTGTITINNSEFAFNGVSDPNSAGYGRTHNIYVGAIATLTINNSFFFAANVGHEIKSRAANNIIENSRIDDGPTGTASYSIDLPNGGNALIQNNVIEQGPQSQNAIIVAMGEEGVTNPTSSLQIIGNTVLNDLSLPVSLAVENATSVPVEISGNQFYGLTAGQIATGPNTQSDNIYLTNEPALDTSAPYETQTACYCRGTLVATECGEVAVEDLKIGDLVMTHGGWLRPVKWIGRRAYAGRFVAGNRDVLPIVIRAGALDEGVPARDLRVSPEHALFLDEVLVPARHLVNGLTITQADAVERLEYFHVDLGGHDVILAERAAAESFVDCDSRGMFQNAGEYASLYPDDRGPSWAFCAPRLEAASAELVAIRARLALRAGIAEAGPEGLEGKIDFFDGRRMEGWALSPGRPDEPVRLEVLCDGELVGHVVAEQYRADLEAAGKGGGRCSFSFLMPVSLDPLRGHVAELRRASDGLPLPGSPVTLPAVKRFDAAVRQALSGLLATVAPEDVDAAIGYLVSQTERLLAARAGRDGGARGAVADLHSRWGGLVPSSAPRESAPLLQPRALFVDDRFPAEGESAGANAAPQQLLRPAGTQRVRSMDLQRKGRRY